MKLTPKQIVILIKLKYCYTVINLMLGYSIFLVVNSILTITKMCDTDHSDTPYCELLL